MKSQLRQTTATVISEAIKRAITSGRLKPGEKLVEMELARRFGVSRTPVREALRILEKERLVANNPYKGYIVNKLSHDEAVMLYQVRAALEPLAVKLATEQITPQELQELKDCLYQSELALKSDDMAALIVLNNKFHDIIARASRNSYLVDILTNLRDLIDLMRVSNFLMFPKRMIAAVAEHRGILEAMLAKDAAAAAVKVSAHIENALNLVPETLQETNW